MGVNRITYWSQGVASLPYKCQPFLLSARHHPSYGDCLEVKRPWSYVSRLASRWNSWMMMIMMMMEYYQNCSVLGCVTQCSQSAAHLCEQFLQVQQIGFVTLGPYAMHRGGCLELYYCNMVEWSWWDSIPYLKDQLVSFSALTLLVWSYDL